MKKVVSIAVILYIASYILFRFVNSEIWSQDGKAYVIFPSWDGKVMYYFYRPLMLIDAKLTGMNFHIGPQQ